MSNWPTLIAVGAALAGSAIGAAGGIAGVTQRARHDDRAWHREQRVEAVRQFSRAGLALLRALVFGERGVDELHHATTAGDDILLLCPALTGPARAATQALVESYAQPTETALHAAAYDRLKEFRDAAIAAGVIKLDR